jgi:hypothetical protein
METDPSEPSSPARPSDESGSTERPPLERNLGEQPLAAIIAAGGYKSADLVKVSSMQLTHKMVSRACKGRRLTPKTKAKIFQAINALHGKPLTMAELFNY